MSVERAEPRTENESVTAPGPEPGVDVDGPAGLLAFRRLDVLLSEAVTAARARYGPEAASDSYRGLYLTEEHVRRSLDQRVASPLVSGDRARGLPPWERISADNGRWAWLRDRYGLSDLELDAVLVALGPDVDRRYEQLYAYLQDHVEARRPTVHLVLDLLAPTPAGRRDAVAMFAGDAPLLRHRIIHLRADRPGEPPLLARHVAVDEQVTAALLGHAGLDRRLRDVARLVDPARPPRLGLGGADPRPLPYAARSLVESVVAAVREQPTPLRLCFHGPHGTGRSRTTLAVAADLGRPVLVLSGSALAREPGSAAELVRLAVRQADYDDAVLHVEDADALLGMPEPHGPDTVVPELAVHPGLLVLSTALPWAPSPRHALGVVDVAFGAPAATERRLLWRTELRASGAHAVSGDVGAVADRFRLSPRQIRDAALTVAGEAFLRPDRPASPRVRRQDLFASARRQTGHHLTGLARRIPPVHTWDDLVLPREAALQLHELAARVEQRTRVVDEWGFGSRLPGSRGVTALFSGPPGTGKTMAASVIAGELGLDLFAIDLSSIVSKYIGETEKNLARVFAAAADTDAILFFDEADALFGKRSEVRDAHDRYANVEIAYLLQRMEEYEGLAVLATNVRHHIDEAFLRRLDVIVEFPFPDTTERERIWRSCLPAGAPLGPDVDLTELAAHRLAGGNIRNAVLGAAYLAAGAGGPIGQGEFVAATRRELAKLGRVLSDLGPDPPDDT